MNDDNDYKVSDRSVLIALVIVMAIVIVLSMFVPASAQERYPHGSTWQIKCEQQNTGQRVQCWMVEVPNQPVPGIDVPFEDTNE